MERNRSMAGFTLIELMVALGIFAIITLYLTQSFTVQHRAYTVVDQVTEVQQNARAIATLLERDVRQAGMVVPEGASVCGVDNTAGPDILYVSASDQLSPAGVEEPDVSMTISFGGSAAFVDPTGGTQTYTVSRADTGVPTLEMPDGGGGPFFTNSDFANGMGVIVTDVNNPDRGSACGVLSNVNSLANTLDVTWEALLDASANPADYRMVPAHRYAIVGTNLQRNGTLLAQDIEDFQVAYFYDADSDGVVDNPGLINSEYRGSAGTTYDSALIAGTAPTDLREIRLNIVIRTRDEDPNQAYDSGSIQATENRAPSALRDGFRRRVHTSQIRVRNVGFRDLAT